MAAVTLADDPIMVLSPALAHAKLHVSSEWSGYFIAALGWGCVFGSVVPVSAGDKGAKRASRYAAFSLLALGASVFVFAQGFSRMVTLIAAITAGIAGLFAGTAAQSALLRHQKDTGASAATVAGVAALWAIAWAGTKPFASLLDGLLAGHVGMVRTSVALIFPAITIALGELLLPRKWKKFINKVAGMITEFITPKLISAANAVLLADFPQLPQAQAPIGYLPPNQKGCRQASFMTARPTEMPAAQRFAIGHVVAGRPIEIVEAHVTQGARIEHSQPAAL